MTEQATSLFSRYNFIKQIPVFAKLNWFDLQKIARRASVVPYKKGDLICQQGNPPDYFYCVLSGRVQALAVDENGQRIEVEFMRRGMHFGIISLLTGENHSLSFTAINDSLILKISKDDFHALLHSIQQLGVTFSQSLSQRLRRRGSKAKSIFESTIISVYSPIKGSGSSTYAVNLALQLEEQTKKKVILVSIASLERSTTDNIFPVQEASPQWRMTPVLLAELVHDYARVTQNIRQGGLAFDRLYVGIDPQDPLSVYNITHFVTSLVVDYHYVVVDLPNEMNDVVMKTLTQSDLAVLISLEKEADLRTTAGVIRQIKENLKENFIPERVQVIINGRDDIPNVPFELLNKELEFPVAWRLPVIYAQDFDQLIETPDLWVRISRSDSAYALTIRKIAREIGRVLVGLVLGGGGALGIAHIGVLKVLEEEKIPIDIIAGSSMGALIAGFWATGRSWQEIEVLAKEFKTKEGMMRLFDPVFPISGFIGGKAIHSWLRKNFGQKTFYDTRIPLRIVAYDLIRRQDIVFNSGAIDEAVRRSIAIPGVIEPIREEGKVIIDGGMLNPLPANVLSAERVHKIIAVNVLQSPDDVYKGYLAEQQATQEKFKLSFKEAPWDYLKCRTGRFFGWGLAPNISDIIVSTLQATGYVLAEQSGHQADVLIHPDLSGIYWFELYRVEELIKRGEVAARAALPKIRQLLKE